MMASDFCSGISNCEPCVLIYIYIYILKFLCFYIYIKIPKFIYIYIYIYIRGPGRTVGMATDYGLDGPGSNPGGDEIFRPSRPALRPTQPPVKRVPGLFLGSSAAGACR